MAIIDQSEAPPVTSEGEGSPAPEQATPEQAAPETTQTNEAGDVPVSEGETQAGDSVEEYTPEAPEAEPQKEFAPWVQNVPKSMVTDEMRGFASQWDYLQSVWGQRDELKSKAEGAVKPLGEEATDEDKAAYRKAMGIPDDPSGYKFDEYPKELAEPFQKVAFDLMLTPDQASALAEFDNQQVEEYKKERQQKAREIEDATRSELKQLFPNDWEQKLQQTNATMERFFGADGMKAIGESGLGIQDWFVKGAIQMAKSLSEGTLPAEGGDSQAAEYTLQDEYPSMKQFMGRKKSWA